MWDRNPSLLGIVKRAHFKAILFLVARFPPTRRPARRPDKPDLAGPVLYDTSAANLARTSRRCERILNNGSRVDLLLVYYNASFVGSWGG